MSRGKRLLEAAAVGFVVGLMASGIYGLGLWLLS